MALRAYGRLAAAMVTVATLLAIGTIVTPAEAAVTQPFAIRQQVNQRGDIMLRGNSLLTCPNSAATCAPARNGTDGGTAANLNNNSYAMEYVDVDGDPATSSSSSAQVTLNSGASVTWAGLYWSGYTVAGSGRTAPLAGTTQNQLKLKTPASSAYTTVTALSTYPGSTAAAAYSAVADVTALVQAGGSGLYTGADIFADAGTDAYAAWTLVIITRDQSQPKRNLTVFDGFGVVQSGDTAADIALTGFETPASGGLATRLGAVTYEGDAGLTGESLTITPSGGSATQISNGLNPANNVFNSTVTESGSVVAGRAPADTNTFGYDADVFDASLLFAGQTSATLRFSTGGETFFPAVATLAADIYAPDLTLVRSSSVVDVDSDGRTRTGDRIDYTVDVTNSNDANSTDSANTVITDVIPAGATYVPGSLKVDGVAVSDAANGDRGEISGNTLTVRLGTGAGGSTGSGGTLVKGGTTRVTYSVAITGAYTSGGTISSSTDASYDSPTTSTHFTGSSNTDSVTVNSARADLAVTNAASPALVQRDGTRNVTWTATVQNNGPDGDPAPVLTQALPTGATATVTGATCTGGPTYSCNLSALASGASVQVVFTGTLPSNAADPSTATASVSGANTDPTSGNNSDTASVAVNTIPAAGPDTGSLPSAKVSVDVDVLANDSDPDNDPLTLQSVSTPAHGSATIVAGKVRYRLTDSSFTGTDSTTYTVCDDRSGCSTQTLAIAVASHSVADLGVTLSANPQLVQRDGSRVVTWTATVTNSGPSGELGPVLTQGLPAGVTAVTVTGASCTPSGTTYACPLAALDVGESTTVTFTATLPATAPDPATATSSVTGSLTDPAAANNSAVRTVAVNSPPMTSADSATISNTTTTATVGVLGNDSDPDGDPLTLAAVGKPGHGTATISGGSLVYTLTDTAFQGDDAFTYTVCDDRSGCTTGTVTITSADREHAPKAVADKAKTVTGKAVTIDVLGNDTDTDGDTLALAKITTTPKHGNVTISGGRAVYTPDTGYIGDDSFRYQVCDPAGACDTTSVDVAVTSLPPVTKPDTATVKPGGTAVVDVTGNDSDPNGDALGNVTIVTKPAAGTAYVDAEGKIHYTAPAGGVPGGFVTLTYQTCDASGACARGTLKFIVANSNTGSGTANSNATGDDLAYTGAQIWPLTALALALFLGGIGFLVSSRRRRPALSWRSYDPEHGFRRTSPNRTTPPGR